MTSSVEELKGQISAGEYTIDSGELAGEILAKFALIGRVGRLIMGEGEEGAAGEAGRGPRRTARPEPSRPLQPRREGLS